MYIIAKTNKNALIKIIGAKIAYYRSINGMTQKQLADLCSISLSALRKIETGTYNNDISITKLVGISYGLGISVYVLLQFTKYERRMIEQVSYTSEDR